MNGNKNSDQEIKSPTGASYIPRRSVEVCHAVAIARDICYDNLVDIYVDPQSSESSQEESRNKVVDQGQNVNLISFHFHCMLSGLAPVR